MILLVLSATPSILHCRHQRAEKAHATERALLPLTMVAYRCLEEFVLSV